MQSPRLCARNPTFLPYALFLPYLTHVPYSLLYGQVIWKRVLYRPGEPVERLRRFHSDTWRRSLCVSRVAGMEKYCSRNILVRICVHFQIFYSSVTRERIGRKFYDNKDNARAHLYMSLLAKFFQFCTFVFRRNLDIPVNFFIVVVEHHLLPIRKAQLDVLICELLYFSSFRYQYIFGRLLSS